MRALAFLTTLFVAVASAQTPAPLSFDVATIKEAAPPDQSKIMSGQMRVGAKIDGARADYNMMSLQDLICKAYDIKPHQLTGPDWMKTTRWDIQATLPEGAKPTDASAMLQTLLKERFKLEVHKSTKEQNIYALVQAKGGHKLKESEPDPAPAPAAAEGTPKEEPAKDAKGAGQMGMTVNGEKMTMKQTSNGMIMRGGDTGQVKVTMNNGMIHMDFAKMTMAKLAEQLAPMVDRPVMDETQLKGSYQVALELSMGEMMNMARKMGAPMGGPGGGGPPAGAMGGGGGPRPAESASDPGGASSIFGAVEQMGLKLASKKGPVDMIVVDRVEKVPTEN